MKRCAYVLPKKALFQAAVLKRGNYMDILAFKNNEEFLSQEKSYNRYRQLTKKSTMAEQIPNAYGSRFTRKNVQTRAEKLDNNDWNGAIFAAAGLERVGLEFENTIG